VEPRGRLSASTADNNDNADNNKDEVSSDICANCGKSEESTNSLKACTACKMVKYCNRKCQIAHRPQHKKECKRRAAELHDEALFKQPPPQEDCPICFLRMPSLMSGKRYMTCCGKTICSGCIYAPVYDNEGNVVADTCPFCRSPPPAPGKESVERTKVRVELNDAEAIYRVGTYYRQGRHGYPLNYAKALEHWHRSGELGFASAYCSIGICYMNGDGVEVDMKKAIHYWELAAMRGDTMARHNLGSMEGKAGNYDRAVNHYMIAVRSGCNKSLGTIRKIITNERATKYDYAKADYAKALQLYQVYLDEIKSDQRDKAAAVDVNYKYYE
jgi:hypothetical protein